MVCPPYLKQGDKIGIVATGRKVSPADMDKAFGVLQGWGLKVVTGPNLFGANNQYSGTTEERASDFQMMLDDTDIKAIICARGGYGTVKIVDQINFSVFEQHPKWIVGYSDVTVLHSHIHTQFGIETLHATMPINFGDPGAENAIETLRKGLFGENLEYIFAPKSLNIQGNATGVLTGGNLSILYSLLGSPSDIVTQDKILFIEDLDEYLYHVDRMMMNLKRNNKLAGIKGLVVGALSKMHDNTVPFGLNAEEIIAGYAKEAGIPVCFGFPAGHIDDNRTLILGREVQLDIEESSVSLQFLPATETPVAGKVLGKILKPALYILGLFAFIYLVLHLISMLK